MVAYVMREDGTIGECRAKDPAHCPYHKNADGTPRRHFDDMNIAYHAFEMNLERKQRDKRYERLKSSREQLLHEYGRTNPSINANIDAMDASIKKLERERRVDAEWDETCKKLYAWAGGNFMSKEDKEAIQSNGGATRQTILHEASHALVGFEQGISVKDINLAPEETEIDGKPAVLQGYVRPGEKTEVPDDVDYRRQMDVSIAGRQIDEAFNDFGWIVDGENELQLTAIQNVFGHQNLSLEEERHEAGLRAREIITKRIDALIALSDELAHSHRMDGHTAMDIMRKHGVGSDVVQHRTLSTKPPRPKEKLRLVRRKPVIEEPGVLKKPSNVTVSSNTDGVGIDNLLKSLDENFPDDREDAMRRGGSATGKNAVHSTESTINGLTEDDLLDSIDKNFGDYWSNPTSSRRNKKSAPHASSARDDASIDALEDRLNAFFPEG